MASRSASRPRTASTATSSTDDPALRNRFVRVELVSFQVRTGGLAAIVPGNHNNGYLHFALSDGCDTASQVLRWNSDGRSLLFPSHYSNKLLFTGPNERRELRVCVVLCKEDDAAARTARAKFASTMLGDVLAVASPATAAIPTYGPAVQAAVDLSRTALTLATAAADVVETFVSDHDLLQWVTTIPILSQPVLHHLNNTHVDLSLRITPVDAARRRRLLTLSVREAQFFAHVIKGPTQQMHLSTNVGSGLAQSHLVVQNLHRSDPLDSALRIDNWDIFHGVVDATDLPIHVAATIKPTHTEEAKAWRNLEGTSLQASRNALGVVTRGNLVPGAKAAVVFTPSFTASSSSLPQTMSQLWAPSKTAPFMQSIPLLEYENGREFYVLLEDNESQLVDELPDTHRVRKVRVGEGLHGWMRLCVSSTLIDDEDDAATAAPTSAAAAAVSPFAQLASVLQLALVPPRHQPSTCTTSSSVVPPSTTSS